LVRIVANIAFRNKIAQEKVLPHFFWFSFVWLIWLQTDSKRWRHPYSSWNVQDWRPIPL
jgi:hypothetical protein